MSREEILGRIMEEFNWKNIDDKTYLHNPKMDRYNTKTYVANLDQWPAGTIRVLERIEEIFHVLLSEEKVYKTIGDILDEVMEKTNQNS